MGKYTIADRGKVETLGNISPNAPKKDSKFNQVIFPKTFIILLKEHLDILDRYKDIKNFNIFNAIDSRNYQFVYRNQFDFVLNPINRFFCDYFTGSYGATGCYLSHYLIWKKVVDEDIPYALILERDANSDDVKDILQDTNAIPDDILNGNIDFVQLNKRTYEDFDATGGFLGTESYIISKEGCKKLIEHSENPRTLVETYKPFTFTSKMSGLGLDERDSELVTSVKQEDRKTILFPLDIFIGYCTSSELPDRLRLKVKLDSRIGLYYGGGKSEVTHNRNIYTMNRSARDRFRTGPTYGWWERRYNTPILTTEVATPYQFIEGLDFNATVLQNTYDRIFVINLDCHSERFKTFENVENIERISAINTKDDIYKCEEYGFTLNPIIPNHEDYFFNSPGAGGCFVSHYSIWKKMVDEDIDRAIILEDDAYYPDLVSFLRRDPKFSSDIDFVQLNKRTYHQFNFEEDQFIGLEAYVITKRGCKKLLHHIDNPTHIVRNFKIPKAMRKGAEITILPMSEVRGKDLLVPSDILVGCATSPLIPKPIRLNIEYDNCVAIYHVCAASDITLSEAFFCYSALQLKALRQREGYVKWKQPITELRKKRRSETVDLVYLGPSKTGSCSLFRMMQDHPNVGVTTEKETTFFASSSYMLGVNWYAKHFSKDESQKIAIDASVRYFDSDLSDTIPKILEYNPNMKFVSFLRNPVDRIMSRYLHFRQQNYLYELDLISQEKKLNEMNMFWFRKSFDGEARLLSEIIEDKKHGKPCAYFDTSLYIEKVKSLNSLIDGENLHIIPYEDFQANNNRCVNNVFAFCDLPPFDVSKISINGSDYNTSAYDASSEITSEDIKFIQNYFFDANNALSEYLGLNLDWNSNSKWYDII